MPNRMPIYWVPSPLHDQICDSGHRSNVTPRNVSPAPPQLARTALGTAKRFTSLICIKRQHPRTTPGVIQACCPPPPHIPRLYYYDYYIYLIINSVHIVKRKTRSHIKECRFARPQPFARAHGKNDSSDRRCRSL